MKHKERSKIFNLSTLPAYGIHSSAQPTS